MLGSSSELPVFPELGAVPVSEPAQNGRQRAAPRAVARAQPGCWPVRPPGQRWPVGAAARDRGRSAETLTLLSIIPGGAEPARGCLVPGNQQTVKLLCIAAGHALCVFGLRVLLLVAKCCLKRPCGFFLLLTSKIKLYEHLQPGKSECLKEQFHLISWEGNKMPHFEVFCGFLQGLVFVVGRQLARNNVLRKDLLSLTARVFSGSFESLA